MRRQQYLTVTLGGLVAIGASVVLFRTTPVVAQARRYDAVFTSDGKLQLPPPTARPDIGSGFSSALR